MAVFWGVGPCLVCLLRLVDTDQCFRGAYSSISKEHASQKLHLPFSSNTHFTVNSTEYVSCICNTFSKHYNNNLKQVGKCTHSITILANSSGFGLWPLWMILPYFLPWLNLSQLNPCERNLFYSKALDSGNCKGRQTPPQSSCTQFSKTVHLICPTPLILT
jgi:hypothetical protein